MAEEYGRRRWGGGGVIAGGLSARVAEPSLPLSPSCPRPSSLCHLAAATVAYASAAAAAASVSLPPAAVPSPTASLLNHYSLSLSLGEKGETGPQSWAPTMPEAINPQS